MTEIGESKRRTTITHRKAQRENIASPDAFVSQWRFYLPMPRYAATLDLAPAARWHKWTQGFPPVYRFKKGDVFHSDPRVAREGRSVDFAYVSAEVVGAEREKVEFKITHFERGCAVREIVGLSDADDFVEFLRSGQFPASE